MIKLRAPRNCEVARDYGVAFGDCFYGDCVPPVSLRATGGHSEAVLRAMRSTARNGGGRDLWGVRYENNLNNGEQQRLGQTMKFLCDNI